MGSTVKVCLMLCKISKALSMILPVKYESVVAPNSCWHEGPPSVQILAILMGMLKSLLVYTSLLNDDEHVFM